MPTESLAEIVNALTPDRQADVREFIEFPKGAAARPQSRSIIAAHAVLIARFGGSPGLRDMAALESALARPQTDTMPTLSSKQRPSGRVFRKFRFGELERWLRNHTVEVDPSS